MRGVFKSFWKSFWALAVFIVLSALAFAPVYGDDTGNSGNQGLQPMTPAPLPPSSSGRGKSLNFEDDVVEGMNRNPLDSLEHVAKRDSKDGSHLYQKRTDFRREMKATTQEGGFTP